MSDLFAALWSSSDLVVIVGEEDRTIGHEAPLFEKTFRIEATETGLQEFDVREAVLTLLVRGLKGADRRPVVRINDRAVGEIAPCAGVDGCNWFTEAMGIGRGILRAGENEIEIRAAELPEPSAGDTFDGFQIRDLICHYQMA